jgi:hypothetical protein
MLGIAEHFLLCSLENPSGVSPMFSIQRSLDLAARHNPGAGNFIVKIQPPIPSAKRGGEMLPHQTRFLNRVRYGSAWL